MFCETKRFLFSHYGFQHRFDGIVIELGTFNPTEAAEAVIMFVKVAYGFTQPAVFFDRAFAQRGSPIA
jgi:hypothetical protein